MIHIENIIKERDAIPGPRLGDYVIVEGSYERICVLRQEYTTIQTTHVDNGGWALLGDGCCSFSGTSINFGRSRQFDKIEKSALRAIEETKDGRFWTFKDGEVGPDRRVDFTAPCRVFVIN